MQLYKLNNVARIRSDTQHNALSMLLPLALLRARLLRLRLRRPTSRPARLSFHQHQARPLLICVASTPWKSQTHQSRQTNHKTDPAGSEKHRRPIQQHREGHHTSNAGRSCLAVILSVGFNLFTPMLRARVLGLFVCSSFNSIRKTLLV